MGAERNSIETVDYSPWFSAKYKFPLEKASQEEQNGTNFCFIAPSSEELWVRKEIMIETVDYSPWFSGKN